MVFYMYCCLPDAAAAVAVPPPDSHLRPPPSQDGGRAGRFTGGHSNSKVTAVSFDRNQRRLVTAGNDGSIKMWNFNNGSLLRRCE